MRAGNFFASICWEEANIRRVLALGFRLLLRDSLSPGAELFFNTKRREDYTKKIFIFVLGSTSVSYATV